MKVRIFDDAGLALEVTPENHDERLLLSAMAREQYAHTVDWHVNDGNGQCLPFNVVIGGKTRARLP